MVRYSFDKKVTLPFSDLIQAAIKNLLYELLIEDKVAHLLKTLYQNKVPEIELFNIGLITNDFLLSSDVIICKSKRRVPWSGVISEYKKGKILYNPKFYDRMIVDAITGNLAHETAHHFGGKHSFKHTNNRKFYSPYFIGYYVEFFIERYGTNSEGTTRNVLPFFLNHLEKNIK